MVKTMVKAIVKTMSKWKQKEKVRGSVYFELSCILFLKQVFRLSSGFDLQVFRLRYFGPRFARYF